MPALALAIDIGAMTNYYYCYCCIDSLVVLVSRHRTILQTGMVSVGGSHKPMVQVVIANARPLVLHSC